MCCSGAHELCVAQDTLSQLPRFCGALAYHITHVLSGRVLPTNSQREYATEIIEKMWGPSIVMDIYQPTGLSLRKLRHPRIIIRITVSTDCAVPRGGKIQNLEELGPQLYRPSELGVCTTIW